MRLTRAKKRAMANDDGLIPMINIVFLLLVFFMVAGAIKPAQPLDIEPPKSVQTGDQNAVHVVHVALDGSLALDGLVISEAELVQALSRTMSNLDLTELDETELDNVTNESTISTSTEAARMARTGSDLVDTPAITIIEPVSRPALALRADAQITFKRLREVVNVLREAGVSEVEMMTSWIPSATD